MLLKEEFAANMGYLEPSINSMIVAGEGEYQQLIYTIRQLGRRGIMLNIRDSCVSGSGLPWCLVLSAVLVEFCSFDSTA
jgi:hypothetical protein